MFKKIATSVKSAISTNSKKTNESENESKKNLNSIRDRINLEKELNRKNQRLKLVNECRVSGQKNEKSLNSSNLTKSNTDLAVASNYSISEQTADRKKMLEQWRKDRREKTLSLKDNHRPVFKVQNVGPKLFDSKSMSDLKSAKNVDFIIFI